MEFKERKVGVIIERIFIPKGAKIPSALRLARAVDGILIIDEIPRPYPPRSEESILQFGDILTLTEDGQIDDTICCLEQKKSLASIKKLRDLILIKYSGSITERELERRDAIIKGLNKCISNADSIDQKPDSRIKVFKGEGPAYFARKAAEAEAAKVR